MTKPKFESNSMPLPRARSLTLLQGREIANPTGWLTLVTFRRAVEEHRSRSRCDCVPGVSDGARVQGTAKWYAQWVLERFGADERA
jgi:hypothetical protein